MKLVLPRFEHAFANEQNQPASAAPVWPGYTSSSFCFGDVWWPQQNSWLNMLWCICCPGNGHIGGIFFRVIHAPVAYQHGVVVGSNSSIEWVGLWRFRRHDSPLCGLDASLDSGVWKFYKNHVVSIPFRWSDAFSWTAAIVRLHVTKLSHNFG